MPKWLPLVIGMSAFVLAVLASLAYLAFSGSAGKARGLVVINLRTEAAVLTLDDGQTATFAPGEAHTIFARKPNFPQQVRVTDIAGTTLFVEQITYKQISDAEFRIAFDDTRIVYPAAPASKEIPI